MEPLTPEEARVLGCLVEKQMTTPDYYPLSLNALTSACNQRTNRDPVVDYDETIVDRALRELDARGLAGITRTSGGRTVRHVHRADEALEVDDEQLALLAVLLLRGPQTPGELRIRTDRYVSFADVAAVEEVLEGLISRDVPLVARLDRAPGRKEYRYRTLLAGGTGTTPDTPVEPSEGPLADRVAALEARVAELERRLDGDGE
jgi:uncharacterized protein YceH (UPF0502 family)